MNSLKQMKAELAAVPEVQAEYDALAGEFAIARELGAWAPISRTPADGQGRGARGIAKYIAGRLGPFRWVPVKGVVCVCTARFIHLCVPTS